MNTSGAPKFLLTMEFAADSGMGVPAAAEGDGRARWQHIGKPDAQGRTALRITFKSREEMALVLVASGVRDPEIVRVAYAAWGVLDGGDAQREPGHSVSAIIKPAVDLVGPSVSNATLLGTKPVEATTELFGGEYGQTNVSAGSAGHHKKKPGRGNRHQQRTRSASCTA